MNVYIGGEDWDSLFTGKRNELEESMAWKTLRAVLPEKADGIACVPSGQEENKLLYGLLTSEGFDVKHVDHLAVIQSKLHAIKLERNSEGLLARKTEYPLEKSLFVWNGYSPDTLADILLALNASALFVLPTHEANLITVNHIEDIRAMLHEANDDRLTPDDPMPTEEQNDIVERCVPSASVREHLAVQRLTKRQTIKLILGAPLPLSEKMHLLTKHCHHDDPMHELLDEVAKGERIMLPKDHWKRIVGWSFQKNAQAIEDAAGIHDMGINEASIKLKPTTIAIMAQTFLDAPADEKDADRPRFYDETVYGRGYMDITQPFHPGDIVILDCDPFSKPTEAILLAEDQNSSSTPILYRSRPGVWTISRVNIGRRWGDEHQKMSPLYQLERINEECDERMLLELSDLITKDDDAAQLARELARQMAVGDEISDIQLMNILETLRQRINGI